MNFETIIALVLAIAGLGYLLYALLRPEELS
jgi:K+-transporting ATPase KdpF subunit